MIGIDGDVASAGTRCRLRQVRSVYFDKDVVFSAAELGSVILERSTISPELSRNLHQEAHTRGINFLDVAISGSTTAAVHFPANGFNISQCGSCLSDGSQAAYAG